MGSNLMEVFLSAVFMLHVLSLGGGYPTGAPTSACVDMVPRHGVQPQPLPSPYALLTNAKTFQPGEPITVTIMGPDYRGLLLEARTGENTDVLGRWQLPPPDTKFIECTENPQGAMTHSNTNLKGNTTAYTWIPPSSPSVSTVYFIATVAQQRTVFWLNVRSESLTRGTQQGIGLAASGGVGLDHGLLPGFLLAIWLLLSQVPVEGT